MTSATNPGAIGIDFGTTNTVVSLIGARGEARLIDFSYDDREIVAFRSALSFHAPPEDDIASMLLTQQTSPPTRP